MVSRKPWGLDGLDHVTWDRPIRGRPPINGLDHIWPRNLRTHGRQQQLKLHIQCFDGRQCYNEQRSSPPLGISTVSSVNHKVHLNRMGAI